MDSPSSESKSRDGLIDFSRYSIEQLEDLQHSIDKDLYPLNHRNLVEELGRRQRNGVRDSASGNRWNIKFTRRSGFLGWLEARRRRLPLYDEGTIAVTGGEIVLSGWGRTWLGVPVQETVIIPDNSIANLGVDEDLVRFNYGRRGNVAFRAESAAEAQEIAGLVPKKQKGNFDKKWEELVRFNRSIRASKGGYWVSGVIVSLNIVVFLAMAVREKRVVDFNLQQLLAWGGNFGPLTVGGQWWRLFSSTFLHLDPAHLLVNMWAFWGIGKLSERLFGRWTFAFLYIATGILASLASILWDPTRVSLGASGAIFGIFGAFLSYFLRRRASIPKSVLYTHWLSTSAFVLFNLVSGSLQTGIDNAAHIGGLLAGFVLGWIVARPLEIERVPFPIRQAATAAVIFTVATIACIFLARSTGLQLTDSEKYLQAHDWYVSGEAENLRLWQSLSSRAAAGTMSESELGSEFETKILPFWQSAVTRLKADDVQIPRTQIPFATLVLDFAQVRSEWAAKVVALAKGNDTDRRSDGLDLAQQAERISAQMLRLQLRSTMSHRPRALSNSTIVAYVRNHIMAREFVCIRPPAAFGGAIAETDLRTDGPAMRDDIACRAQRAFQTDDFVALQAMFDSYGKTYGDLPDGSSRLEGVFTGLRNLFDYGKVDWSQELGRTSDWRLAFPGTLAPEIVEAILFHEWAWTARGGGYANTVSAQAMAVFRLRTEMAEAALSDLKGTGTQSPLWYELSLEVGIDQAIDLKKLREIFDEGSASFPDFFPLDRQMLRASMPRWFGSYSQVDQFIGDISAKTQESHRAEMYARLWWMYASLEGDEVNIFDKTNVSWPKVKAGFKDMLNRYPSSDYVLNGFAMLTCEADDIVEYKALRSVLKNRTFSMSWSNKVSLQSCDRKFE